MIPFMTFWNMQNYVQGGVDYREAAQGNFWR